MGLCQEEEYGWQGQSVLLHHIPRVDLRCEDEEAIVVLVIASSNTLESPPFQARVGDACSLEEECPADMEYKLPRSCRNRSFLVWFF